MGLDVWIHHRSRGSVSLSVDSVSAEMASL